MVTVRVFFCANVVDYNIDNIVTGLCNIIYNVVMGVCVCDSCYVRIRERVMKSCVMC